MSKPAPSAGPEWIPDEEVEACMTCHSPFTITRRRHHCRKCGKVVDSACSSYTLVLPAITGTVEPVRVCIECYTDVTAKRRGLSRQSLIEFISSQMKVGGALPPHKRELIRQLQALGDEKDRQEKQLLAAGPDAVHPSDDAPPSAASGGANGSATAATAAGSGGSGSGGSANGNGSSNGSSNGSAGSGGAGGGGDASIPTANTPISAAVRQEVDMIAYQKAYSDLAKRHTAVADELTEWRLKNGMVATVVFPGESQTINFWSHRYLVITPAPNSHIGLTGFIYPHPSMANLQSTREIGFQFIRNMEELTSARTCSFSFKNSSGADVALNGISLGWLPPTEAVTTAPVGAGNAAPKPVMGAKKPEAKPAVAKPEPPPRLRFIVIENEEDNKDLTGKKSTVKKAINRGLCDELLATLHAHMKYAMDRVRQQKKIVDVYCKYIRTEVSWQQPEHEALLKRLWAGFAPGRQFPGTKHELWKGIGFQGSDPVTDFRGMGYLGLHCLVYMGETYPEAVAKLMTPERNYPVCCAGINLVFVLADLLQLSARGVNLLTVPLFKLSCRGDGNRIGKYFMQELMSLLLPYLDKLFVEAKAGYMDFPTHFGALKAKLIQASAQDPDSIETLIDVVRGTDEQTAARESVAREAREKQVKEEHDKRKAVGNAMAASKSPVPPSAGSGSGTATRLAPPALTIGVNSAAGGVVNPHHNKSLTTPLSGKGESDTDTTPSHLRGGAPTTGTAADGLKAHDNWKANDHDDDSDDDRDRMARAMTVSDGEDITTPQSINNNSGSGGGDIKTTPVVVDKPMSLQTPAPPTTTTAAVKKSPSLDRVTAPPPPPASPAPGAPAPTTNSALTATPNSTPVPGAARSQQPATAGVVAARRPPPSASVIVKKPVIQPSAASKSKPAPAAAAKKSWFGSSLFGGKSDT